MKKNISVALFFCGLTVISTFPLIFKINSFIPGFFSTSESFAALWHIWRIKYSILHGFDVGKTFLAAYPFGIDFNSLYGAVSYFHLAMLSLLSLATNPILTWNIQVLFNLFLSGLVTYALVYYLTGNTYSAIFSGIIFAFCPYQFMRVWQHLGLTYNQWLPLILLTAILLREKASIKREIVFLVSFLLLLSFDFSIMYMGLIALMSFLVYHLMSGLRLKTAPGDNLLRKNYEYLIRILIICAIGAIILSFQFAPIIKRMLSSCSSAPSAFNAYHRPFDDLFPFSARPLSYFLPAVVHPVFGRLTEGFIGSPFYGVSFTEHTLYLGWIPLCLAFVALQNFRKLRNAVATASSKDSFYLGFFIFLTIVAWFFSQPPWWRWGGFRIYMPSFFMYKVLSMFRSYSRFGIVVMLGIAVLAGFGLKVILEKFKSTKSKIVITALFCVLVLFEFWNYPPFKVIDVSKAPQVYYWLKEQPGDFAIAEYPLDANGPNELYGFYQITHAKKMINGTFPNTLANRIAKTITQLSSSHTAGVLKWLGVKYVIVHRDAYLKSELAEDTAELDKISHNVSLRQAKSFSLERCLSSVRCVKEIGPVDVYEVVAAQPLKPQIDE